MARTVLSYTLSVSSRRSNGTIITRRYPNASLSLNDDQARTIQDVVNSFDEDLPNYLRVTRIDNIDTEPDD
ncbi:hypothetical protein [Lacticaseibacillus sp. GG6-2]